MDTVHGVKKCLHWCSFARCRLTVLRGRRWTPGRKKEAIRRNHSNSKPLIYILYIWSGHAPRCTHVNLEYLFIWRAELLKSRGKALHKRAAFRLAVSSALSGFRKQKQDHSRKDDSREMHSSCLLLTLSWYSEPAGVEMYRCALGCCCFIPHFEKFLGASCSRGLTYG